MEGIRKYKEIYKQGIELGFVDLYNKLKKEEISNEERLKRLEILIDNNLWKLGKSGGVVHNEWKNKEGYILSKKIECIIWDWINKDNYKIFGVGWNNFIDNIELKELIEFINKKTTSKKWDAKLGNLEKEGGLLIDVEDNFKYYDVSVKKNRDKVKKVIIEDGYGKYKVNKDKVLKFLRDRRELLKKMNESYGRISRWLNFKFKYELEKDNNIEWFVDRIICTVYYEVKDGKLLSYNGRLHDLKRKGYISDDLINDVVMMKRRYMKDSDEKMIEWISGYKERKKEYDDDYKVKKVLDKGIKDKFSWIEV